LVELAWYIHPRALFLEDFVAAFQPLKLHRQVLAHTADPRIANRRHHSFLSILALGQGETI
jgi:hypothetical protein